MNHQDKERQALGWLLAEKYNLNHRQFQALLNNSDPKSRTIRDNIMYDLLKIKSGEPLDYIIGFTKFLDCKIDLSYRPLIPRSETEYWVEKAILEIKESYFSHLTSKKQIKILDIFSGSGCIGIALLKHLPWATVILAEKNKNFILQIKKNLRLNNISSKRYKVVPSDIFSRVQGKYDYIFANPPYVANSRIKRVQKSVLKWEPHEAILGGSTGLYYIDKLLKQAQNFLKPKGAIFLEFDTWQKKDLEKLLKKCHYTQWSFRPDQYQRLRWVKII
ncbi:MAG: HemK family protein methyltransferase [Candidatus Pacebacteria bacterium]|nr:HemK family protein methyltransferase [Candidatus Paceibacterota bacterium]